MPPKIERLDTNNILEIQEIRKILVEYEKNKKKNGLNLLEIFKLLTKNTNKVLNDDRLDAEIEAMELEEEDESFIEILSDHSSDED
jgi:hypothetical protein